MEATALLRDDKIAGFLRYEKAPDGTIYCSTIHAHYHWDPNSVFRVGDHVFARYTNDHGAVFMLTREQLKRAIASGGFLVAPYKGNYSMMVTAATDPYTQCSMEKVVCISHIDDFSFTTSPTSTWEPLASRRRNSSASG